MANLRDGEHIGQNGPKYKSVAVDVSAIDQNLSPACRGLLASGSGNVALVLEDDADGTVLVFAVTAGVPLTGYSIRRIKHTSTTATGIVAFP